jgi:hypothetical protein
MYKAFTNSEFKNKLGFVGEFQDSAKCKCCGISLRNDSGWLFADGTAACVQQSNCHLRQTRSIREAAEAAGTYAPRWRTV